MVARSGPRNTRLVVVGLVAASLAIITLDYREGDSGPLAEAGRAAQTFMAPLQKAVTTATRPVGDFFVGLAHLPSLARENQDLKNQVADLQGVVAQGGYTKDQVQQLEDQLGLRASLSPDPITALVIANGVSNFEYSITIDKGANDGVEVDQPVVTGSADGPRLVGLVSSVTGVSADVRLLIDRDFSVAGKLQTSGVTGLVVGQGEQDPRMDLVPAETEFPAGDQPEYVFTTTYHVGDEHGRYPPGILIGQVSKVYQGSSPLADVTISPSVDFTSLEYVAVLRTTPGGGTNG